MSYIYNREFDPGLYAHDENDIEGLSMVVDPDTKVQQIAGHDDTIMIDVAIKNGKEGAYGIFFGPDCEYNCAERISSDLQPNPQLITILGAIKALQLAPLQTSQGQAVKVIIVKVNRNTKNHGLYEHITETVWKWVRDDWVNSSGKPVGFKEQYQELHELLFQLKMKMGIEVKFWGVEKECNGVAAAMARKVFLK